MFSVDGEIVLSGESHGVSELVSEGLVVLGSESVEGIGDIGGDGGLVEDDVLTNDSHVLLWALGDLNDVVEGSPVEGPLVNGLADWEGLLLESLEESNDGNDASDGLHWVLVLVGLLEEINGFVEDESSLVGFVDAEQEVGEVEGANLGGLEEALDDLSSHGSGEDLLLFLLNWGGLSLGWSGGELENRSEVEAKLIVFLILVGPDSLPEILSDGVSVHEEVLLENLEVLSWVGGNIEG